MIGAEQLIRNGVANKKIKSNCTKVGAVASTLVQGLKIIIWCTYWELSEGMTIGNIFQEDLA